MKLRYPNCPFCVALNATNRGKRAYICNRHGDTRGKIAQGKLYAIELQGSYEGALIVVRAEGLAQARKLAEAHRSSFYRTMDLESITLLKPKGRIGEVVAEQSYG